VHFHSATITAVCWDRPSIIDFTSSFSMLSCSHALMLSCSHALMLIMEHVRMIINGTHSNRESSLTLLLLMIPNWFVTKVGRVTALDSAVLFMISWIFWNPVIGPNRSMELCWRLRIQRSHPFWKYPEGTHSRASDPIHEMRTLWISSVSGLLSMV
jgi:hypothetical protein